MEITITLDKCSTCGKEIASGEIQALSIDAEGRQTNMCQRCANLREYLGEIEGWEGTD